MRDDSERLLAFYNVPAEHRLHLKTPNPIGSTSSTVRLGTEVTKGPGSRAAGPAVACGPIESARWRGRAVDRAHLVVLVRAGATFRKGVVPAENESPEDEVAARSAGRAGLPRSAVPPDERFAQAPTWLKNRIEGSPSNMFANSPRAPDSWRHAR